MEFKALASGSTGNLHLASEGGVWIAVECGVPFSAMRRLLEFRIPSLAGCLLSHSHGDHSKAVPQLLKSGIDVWAMAATFGALGVNGVPGARRIEAGRRFEPAPGWRALAWEARHDAEGAVGFLLGSPSGDRLLYACDTCFVPNRFAGLTHIAVEANFSRELLRESDAPSPRRRRVERHHMSIERVLDLLEANDLSKVREIHLLHLSDEHADAELFAGMVRRAAGKPVFVAPRLKGGA